MDRLQAMQVFATVVDAHGFANAARRLGISRASVSKFVAELEQRLGARLLHRTTRNLSVTPAGAAYYERCKPILIDVAEAEALFKKKTEKPRGNLRVLTPINFTIPSVGDAVSEFIVRYPDVSLEITLSDRPADPLFDGYDITVRVMSLPPQPQPDVEAVRLGASSRILCASTAYLKRRGKPRTPKDLGDHVCLSYAYIDEPSIWRLAQGKKQFSVRVTGPLITSSGQILRAAAMRGLGIAYGPVSFFRNELETGQLEPVLPRFSLPPAFIFSFHARDRRPSQAVQAFNTFMTEFLSREP